MSNHRCIIDEYPEGLAFVDIGTQDERPGKWYKDTLTYAVINYTRDIEGTYTEDYLTSLVLSQWAIHIDLKFKKLTENKEDADIRIYFKPAKDDDLFRDRPSVLAYAYYPEQGRNSGIIVFNDDKIWTKDGKEVNAHEWDPVNYPDPNTNVRFRSYDYYHTLLHETGHMLGLTHSVNTPKAVMWAFANGVRILHDEEVVRIRKKYNIRDFNGNWNLYLRLKNWFKIKLSKT